jgi:hypothetical protein
MESEAINKMRIGNILFVFNGEVKEGEKGGFVLGLRLRGADSEHGDEWLHGFSELASAPL